MRRMIYSPALLFALIAALPACHEPAGPVAVAIEKVAGDGQAWLAAVPLPDSLVVRLTDGEGAPVAGATVTWTASAGAIQPATAVTGPDGVAMALWVPASGGGTATATVGARTVQFDVSVGDGVPGVTYRGRNGYISYTPGTIPLILSAPHGGQLEPAEIPDRTEGTMVRDSDTDLLVVAMADSIEAQLGGRPYVIISHLHRRKLDPNREIDEAAQGHPLAGQAYNEFQAFIGHARAAVEAGHGTGFYIDVHGHGHDIGRLELGYLLDAGDLALDDAALAGLAGRSSIAALAAASATPFPDLLRGADALGTLFEDAGVPAVPSLQQPDPGEGNPYFSGGYNTRRHGSRLGGAVDGVQIESHRPGIRDTAENRARFAGRAASVLHSFLATHYGFEPVAAGTPEQT